jgi:hypothetical protein
MSKENENLNESENSALNIADVISRLSDDKIDNIIYELDEYARNYDSYQYGLPIHGEHIENMRIFVKQFLNGL